VHIAIAKIEACKTSEDVIAVTNSVIVQARKKSQAFQSMVAPMPVESIGGISTWLAELRAATRLRSGKGNGEILALVYAILRTAVRKIEAIEKQRKH